MNLRKLLGLRELENVGGQPAVVSGGKSVKQFGVKRLSNKSERQIYAEAARDKAVSDHISGRLSFDRDLIKCRDVIYDILDENQSILSYRMTTGSKIILAERIIKVIKYLDK
jgi:hypothetical protein